MTEIKDLKSGLDWMDRSLAEGSSLGKCSQCDQPLTACQCIKRTPKVNYQLLRGLIAIKPDTEKTRIGSIWIPDTARERIARERQVNTGTVLAMGPGMKIGYSGWKGATDRWPMPPIGPGSRVIYRTWSGHDVELDGKKCRLTSDDNVDAEIVEDSEVNLFQDRLLVRRRDRVGITHGGIIIPDDVQRNSLEGEVVAIGPGKIMASGWVRPCDVAVGERVVWMPMSGADVTIGAETLVLLYERDLIGAVTGELQGSVQSTRWKEE